MLSRAEQVLSRISHQKAAEVGSLTGRMVAVENPQTMANINRVYCQAGLLFQQQRRLDDPQLSSYIKGVMEHRLNDEDNEADCLVVRRHLSLLAHQALIRLQSLVDSARACEACAESNDRKVGELREATAEMDRARARHELLAKCDALAANIGTTYTPTKQTEEEAKALEQAIEARAHDLTTVAQLSQTVHGEVAACTVTIGASLERLQMMLAQLRQLAATNTAPL